MSLYFLSFVRYSHSVGEGWGNGQGLPSSPVVALISRRVVVQGNVTLERVSHLRQCVNAGEEVFSHINVLRRKTAPLKSHCDSITVYKNSFFLG